MEQELNDTVAIVTGGGRGFGRAIAIGLADAGARVTVTSRTAVELHETVKLIHTRGGQALAVAGDVTNPRDVARVVELSRSEFGPATLLVNNAGVPGPFGPVGALDAEQWWQAQEVHLRAPLLYINLLLPGMIEAGSGCVIIICAKGAHLVAPNLSAYCVGKAAQKRLLELVAAEQQDTGIEVFAIDPGFVITELARDTMNSPDAQRWLPDMVRRLQERAQDPDSDPEQDLQLCARRCVALASGRYRLLSGKYMEMHEDLDRLLREVELA